LIHLPFSEVKRFLEEGEAQVKQHDMPDGWRGDGSRLITLALDEDDVLIGTPRGLYRIDRKSDLVVEDNRFGNLSRMNEYGSPNPIFHLENDGYGNIWIRSSRKYQYAEKAEDGSFVIHQNIPGRIDDNVSNAIVPDGPGRAWFLGSEGIVYFDHNLSSVVQAGSPVIRRVTSRSDSLLYQGYNRQKSELMELVLPYELNDFRIEFGFPDFNSFDDTEYEVQLEGFDEGWSIWNTEAQKDYTQVREGRYRFMVRAKAGSGYVTEAAVLSIRILPPWYRTIWAYLFYISAVSFLLFSMHKYRVNRILEIQQVRNRIASDLHDDVSATLSSITFFTQAIERNRNSDKAAHYLNLISESAGEAKEKMSDIIWSINPEHDNWENLISKCKRYAADLLESKNIQYELSFPDQGRGKVGIELRQNIWLIFKELITNIARHSNAEHVEIEFFFSGQELKVRVSDNGDGFEANELKQGNGIGNIKNRVAELGGVADLKSEPETGTVWMISLPV
jgi:signal transduction histidine kinase